MNDYTLSRQEQIRNLKPGKGIQYILDESYKILGNPMLILDMEYKLVAFSNGTVNDDPIWNEFMTCGGLCAKTLEFFKDENFIDDVANSSLHEGITYLISDKLKYNRIFGQIYDEKHMPIADLCAVACDKPFEDDIRESIKAICSVLSIEFSQNEYYQTFGQTYQENIMTKLIERSIEDKELYAAHVANIYSNLKTNIFVAVAGITKSDPTYNQLVYFRDLFKQTQPAFKYCIYADYVVFLMSSENIRPDIKKDLHEFNRLFKDNNIYVGISNGFDNLYETRKYYLEAVNTLNFGLRSNNKQRIFLYEDIYSWPKV